jgi:hypothetical protein
MKPARRLICDTAAEAALSGPASAALRPPVDSARDISGGIRARVHSPLVRSPDNDAPPAAGEDAAVGLPVAAPLAVTAVVLVQMLYLEDSLGERVTIMGAG